jgi:hypothetical protein
MTPRSVDPHSRGSTDSGILCRIEVREIKSGEGATGKQVAGKPLTYSLWI